MIGFIKNRFRIDEKRFSPVLKSLEKILNLDGDCYIKLVNQKEALHLNQTYRRRNYVPDVLSFPMNLRLPEQKYLGDIAICFPVAKKQAQQAGHSLEEELLLLIIHGVLHLAGMDHESDQGEMLAKQTEIFSAVKNLSR